MPDVSVVLPTYNRASFLPDTIRSVLEQTHADLECIVVDGGSDDGTEEILDGVGDDRLVVERRAEPNGPANARNTAMELARGDYIMFLDDDDRLYSNAVERLVEVLSGQPADCAGVFPAYRMAGEQGIELTRSVPEGMITLADLADENVIGGPSGTLFRRTVFDEVGDFDESFPAREDIDMWFRILSSYHMVGVDEVLYERWTHEDQMINDNQLMLEAQQRLIEKHGAKLSDRHRAARHQETALRLAALGRTGEARQEIFRSLRPDSLRKRYLYYSFWLLFGATGYSAARRGHDLFHRIKY
jgi:glycosyltransferase involved in cell wall biosynthesis